jgi:hypothetical protein
MQTDKKLNYFELHNQLMDVIGEYNEKVKNQIVANDTDFMAAYRVSLIFNWFDSCLGPHGEDLAGSYHAKKEGA